MSNSGERCEYVLDPDDSEAWGCEETKSSGVRKEYLNDEGIWTCPHTVGEGENLCVFHRPVSEKSETEVIDRFLELACETSGSETNKRDQQFIGAQFESFDLTDYPSEAASMDGEIDLTQIEVAGSMDWSGLEINADELRFKNSCFNDGADFAHTTFNQNVNFAGAQFLSDTSFGGTKFLGGVSFAVADFYSTGSFVGAALSEVAFFDGTKFHDRVSFMDAIFGDSRNPEARPPDDTYTRFVDTRFDESSTFENALFKDTAWFGNVEFQSVAFCGVEFEDQVEFGGVIHGLADFTQTKFHGNTLFYMTLGDRACFNESQFKQTLEFSNQELAYADFEKADLTDAIFSNANLRNANFESALLSRATLFGTDLRGARLNGALLGDVRIDQETRFLGHPADDTQLSQHTISAIRSKLSCVYDPKYEDDNEHENIDKAKSVYRALEELAGKAARPRLQSQCFVRRQDLQTDGYKQVMLNAPSIQERFIAGARYSRAKVARGTLLYGESPWRIIAGSISLIFLFTLLYPLGGWVRPIEGEPITYGAIAENPWLLGDTLYYSTLTFTTLGLGDYRPVGVGQYLTTANTALGAVLIALLVFVLGRRAAR